MSTSFFTHAGGTHASEPMEGAGGNARGFTLLEVLIAVAIFSVVLIAMSTVFFAALRLRRTATEALESSRPLERALTILKRDLENATGPGGAMAGNFRSSGAAGTLATSSASSGSSSGSGTSTASTTGSKTSVPAAGTLQNGGLDFFTTTGHLSDEAPWADIQEVNYVLATPADLSKARGQDFVRTTTRNLLTVSTPSAEKEVLLTDVERVDFSFYDGNQWRDTWDTTSGDTTLPQAVRVIIQAAVDPERTTVKLQPVEMLVLLHGAAAATDSSSTNSTSTQ
jgi:prepilin-type N-terminal cleavage/methylation domain-containing protein